MTDADLSTLEALASAATPGPWRLNDPRRWEAPDGCRNIVGGVGESAIVIARYDDGAGSNYDYIVAACNALPQLIAEVRKLQTERLDAYREIDRLRDLERSLRAGFGTEVTPPSAAVDSPSYLLQPICRWDTIKSTSREPVDGRRLGAQLTLFWVLVVGLIMSDLFGLPRRCDPQRLSSAGLNGALE